MIDGAGEAADAAAAGSTEIIDSTIGGLLSKFIGDEAAVKQWALFLKYLRYSD